MTLKSSIIAPMVKNENILVGKALRELRAKVGMTQEKVAAQLAVPQSFVSKVETGERSLKLSEAFQYAEALGIQMYEIVATVQEQIAEGNGSAE